MSTSAALETVPQTRQTTLTPEGPSSGPSCFAWCWSPPLMRGNASYSTQLLERQPLWLVCLSRLRTASCWRLTLALSSALRRSTGHSACCDIESGSSKLHWWLQALAIGNAQSTKCSRVFLFGRACRQTLRSGSQYPLQAQNTNRSAAGMCSKGHDMRFTHFMSRDT